MRSYNDLKKILELWERGLSRNKIAAELKIPRGTVWNCINRFGTLAQLEAVMNGEVEEYEPQSPSESEKRRYIIPPAVSFQKRARKYSDEELIEAVRDSVSLAEVLRKLGIRDAGGNYVTLKQNIQRLGLDISHIGGQGWAKGKRSSFVRNRSLEEILVKDSTYTSTFNLKNRLLAEGIFQHQCVSCKLTEWLERPIPLEIDHINGDRRDNRLENLRLLCPNCHALTETYRGRNKS